jgi:hypothetical protein
VTEDSKRVFDLIEKLDSTPVQTSKIARAKNKAFSDRAFATMLASGVTYGQAAGSMPWLNVPNAPEELRKLDNDLTAQVSMTDHVIENWFQLGEPVAPHYPFRIAVILRKRKQADLEDDFLRSYGRHFISHHPGTQSYNLRNRIEKVLGLDRCEELWVQSEALEERPEEARQIRKLGAFPRNHRLLDGGAHHFDFQFICRRCGAREISIPDDRLDAAHVTCSQCATQFGTFGGLRSYCNWIGLEEIRDQAL